MEEPKPKIPSIDQIKESVVYSRVALVALAFITGGVIFYHLVEHFSWLNAYYFTIITLATVGYGDFVPKTAAGKIFTTFYVFVGITIFLVLARIILGRVVTRQYARRQTKDNRD
ncbi:MAG TPA: potassium channel family protein [Candidatus Saccharimonadales bacterium]|nr:potassium channel family protein [Candidatus Saccharimonadales bacterium]